MTAELIELVRVLDMIDDDSLEDDLQNICPNSSRISFANEIQLNPIVINEINNLSETELRRNLITKLVTCYSDQDIQPVIEYYQTRIRIVSLPWELKTKIVTNLPVKTLRIFYASSLYKKIIDEYLNAIPETVTESTDEGLLNSLICLPMFVKELIVNSISNFTIEIIGKRINDGYILPVKVNITITTSFLRTDVDIYQYSGYGTIDNNRATGNWTLDGTQAMGEQIYKRRITRTVSFKKPYLLFTSKLEVSRDMIIFNPVEKYYIYVYGSFYPVRFYKYKNDSYTDIKTKYQVEDVRTESLDNYPVEKKIVHDMTVAKNYQKVQGKVGIVRRIVL